MVIPEGLRGALFADNKEELIICVNDGYDLI